MVLRFLSCLLCLRRTLGSAAVGPLTLKGSASSAAAGPRTLQGKGPPTDPPTPSPTTATPTDAPTTRMPSEAPSASPIVSIESCRVLPSVNWLETDYDCALPCCEMHDADAGTAGQYRFEWPYTEEITESLDIDDVAVADGLDFPVLTKVGRFRIYDNPNLRSVQLPELVEAESVEFTLNDNLLALSFPKLTTVMTTGTDDADFIVQRNDLLASLLLPKLTKVGRLRIGDNDELSSVELPELVEAESVKFIGHDKLVALSLPKLTAVETETGDADFIVQGNDLLASLLAPELSSVHAGGDNQDLYIANFMVTNCAALQDLAFDSLATISSSYSEANLFIGGGNDNLETLSFKSMTTVEGGVEGYGAVNIGDPVLSDVQFPKLTGILPDNDSSELGVACNPTDGCQGLASLEFPRLRTVPLVFVNGQQNLTDVHLPAWKSGYALWLFKGNCAAADDRVGPMLLRLCALRDLDDFFIADPGCYEVKGTAYAEQLCADAGPSKCNVTAASSPPSPC